MRSENRITVVMITHNRQEEVIRSLTMFHRDAAAPPIIVVDNASSDGTCQAIESRFPAVRLVRASANLGTMARNLGVELAQTRYVSLADDDTYWEPGSASLAADLFDRCPRLGIVVGRVLNGKDNELDSICEQMEQSPIPRQPGMPGPSLLGFLAGASAVRRDVFLRLGGFASWAFLGGEEELLALNFAMAGWWICYVSGITVHHFPSAIRDTRLRQINLIRNRLWSVWLRRSPKTAVKTTVEVMARSMCDSTARQAICQALLKLPQMLWHRRPVPYELEQQLESLEHQTIARDSQRNSPFPEPQNPKTVSDQMCGPNTLTARITSGGNSSAHY